ncbi:MAG: hypothetical protein JST54_02210 [Deltaproteobacteria bacterium]|nr:hypothetical protein [Deltaproteobacteria bacterium]
MIAFAAALLLAAAPPSELATAKDALAHVAKSGARWSMTQWSSPDLAANLLGDPGIARVGVELPRREAECLSGAAKCWLVLYLPGFDGSPDGMAPLAKVVDELDQRGSAAPIVMVVLDGRTKLGGGWYLDSPTSGKWESLVMQVLLPAARDALAPGTPPERTLVMGHSMGGFGALHLLAAHPESFAAAAAFNPAARIGLIASGTLVVLDQRREFPDAEARLAQPSEAHFTQRILLSLGAALDPDPSKKHGLSTLFEPAVEPWHLAPEALAAMERADPTSALKAHPKLRARIYAGRKDNLVPLAQLEPLASGHVELIATDGDHLSHLAADLKDALEQLAK